jgi:hypothetical protein
MNTSTIAKYLLVICIPLLLLLGAILIITIKKDAKGKKAVIKQKKGSYNGFYRYMYQAIANNFMTRSFVKKIRTRIEIIHDYSEPQIRKTTVKIFFFITAIIVMFNVIFVRMTWNVYLIILFSIASYYLADTILDYFIDRIKTRLMYQQIMFNEQIRHKYYELKMVDEAIYEASQDLPRTHYEISLQGDKIYEVLMAKEAEQEMIGYNEAAPNKYLKMLMGLSYMTKEYGDTQIENGASLYMKSLNYLNNEIRMEVLKRDRLNYALKSLSIIVLVPLFFMEPIKKWASHNFMPLRQFYESQTGFLFQLGIIALVVLCFFLLRRIQKIDEDHSQQKFTITKNLYDKGLYKWIDPLIPKNHTQKYQQIEKNINEALSQQSMAVFYTRKFLTGVTFLILSVGLFVSLKHMQKNKLLYDVILPQTYLGGQLSEEELNKARAITDLDREVIQAVGKKGTQEQILFYVQSNTERINEESLHLQTERIWKKIQSMNQTYMKWWEVILCLFFFFLGYCFPNILLVFQRSMKKIDMEEEVAQFQTILLILMHIHRISVFEIIEWMELYATHFKVALGNCLNNYEAGAIEALENLKKEAPYSPFIHIVNNLIIAVEELDIKEAFDELESEKAYYQELRKMTNERIISKKQWMGQLIGFIPTHSLIVFYLLIPMLVRSFSDMETYFNNLSVY